ncbi:MAG: RNA polymerase sigma factor [Chloroflexota bacterium]|nr:RNA polymerase sigma factor [Chloroflexota bacterium]
MGILTKGGTALAATGTAVPVDERGIVEAVVGGDADAFRELVEANAALVFGTCYRVLGHLQEAEDAAQDTFVTAYRALGTYRGEGTVSAWLARIAIRQALRRREQGRSTTPLESLSGILKDEAGQVDPLAVAVDSDRRRRIRDSIAALPPSHREVVALKYLAELSLPEIAALTRRPLGTVKTHLHRGLQELRRSLGEEPAR